MPTEEQQLVARARAGDDDAFDALVALHHGRVYRTAYAVAGPADVDEVVQETWVRAWRGLARFRGDAGLGTWLTRLAVNAAADVHRRRRTRATLTAALGRFLPPFAPAPTDAVEDRDELRRGLDSLDPDAGRLLGLRFGLDYSVAEIAVVLGCPEGTAKSRLHAATAALRRDVYAWVEGDAFVELHTTLDRAEARRVIEGLEPTALTAVVPRVLSPVVLPTEVPLAQRRRGVEAPRADWRAAVQPCGAWDPDLYRRAPPEAYGQVMCIARAIVGVDPAGGYGLSRYRWREAAERLGVDPAAGPRPDAEVWFAQFPEAVVVLDAETAAPYVLVRLAPVDPVVVRTS